MSKPKPTQPGVQEMIAALGDMTVATLHKLGRRIAGGDFAVMGFNQDHNKRFYRNRETLTAAITRALEIGAFDHVQQALELIRREASSVYDKHDLERFEEAGG